jgi:PIN domain nuclease of toxin-antitoxin system
MLLLDTNVWFKRYWRLPLPAALERRLENEGLAISPISVLETATKMRKRHFPGIPPLDQWLSAAIDGYFLAALTAEIAAAAGADPWNHQDPADRLIVHTAKSNQFTLAHTDSVIRQRTDLRQAYFKPSGVGP